MRIDQILPSCGSRDAIGTEVQIFRELIQSAGFESRIYAQNSWDVEHVHTIDDFQNDSHQNNILIQHFSTGSDISYLTARSQAYNICRFHNVTPPIFFPQTSLAYTACQLGYAQIPLAVHSSQEVWVDSWFNASCLGEGPKPPLYHLPVLRDYQKLATSHDDAKLEKTLDDDVVNLLVVGRVSRNKCLHDSLFLLKTLKNKQKNKKFRVIVCGILETDYVNLIFSLLEDLQLSYSRFDDKENFHTQADVLFMGSITDEQLATCYRKSLALLCMSEHEGFCVPLVEAMSFDIPILAHQSTAIPETCGDGAILIDKNKNPEKIYQEIVRLSYDQDYQRKVIEKGAKRARDYQFHSLKEKFKERLDHTVQSLKTTNNWGHQNQSMATQPHL